MYLSNIISYSMDCRFGKDGSHFIGFVSMLNLLMYCIVQFEEINTATITADTFSPGMFIKCTYYHNPRYQLQMSHDLHGEFLNIGDGDGWGEDHCEFVGADQYQRAITASKQYYVLNRKQGSVIMLFTT